MRAKSLKSFIFMGIIAAGIACVGTTALAADTAAIDSQVSATLDRFYALSPNNKGLVQKAAAVLVFPHHGVYRCRAASRVAYRLA